MMKLLIYILPILLLFISCIEEIDIGLNSSSSRIVIEANYLDYKDSVEVRIFQSNDDYLGIDQYEDINNAEVLFRSIKDDNYTNIPLVGEGEYAAYYSNPLDFGEYEIVIHIGDLTYISTSVRPLPIKFDSVKYEFFQPPFGDTSGYIIRAFIYDPQDIKNFGLVRIASTAELSGFPPYFLYEDQLTNGKVYDFKFYELFQPGDTVQISIENIDPNVYLYKQTLFETFTYSGVSPGNPISNFDPPVLGYFSASSYDFVTVIIPPSIDTNWHPKL